MSFDGTDTSGFYDEMFETDGSPRASARLLFERLRSVGDSEVRRYQQSAEQALFRMGITFNVYGDEAGTEKIFPFDIIPRIVPANEPQGWCHPAGPDLLGKILPRGLHWIGAAEGNPVPHQLEPIWSGTAGRPA